MTTQQTGSQTPSQFDLGLGQQLAQPVKADLPGAVTAIPIGGQMVLDRKVEIRGFSAKMRVAGASTTNTIVLRKNFVAISGATLSIPGDAGNDGDLFSVSLATPVTAEAGDVLDFNVTAVAGSGSPAGLFCAADVVLRFD